MIGAMFIIELPFQAFALKMAVDSDGIAWKSCQPDA
jgi:hypothetical protein